MATQPAAKVKQYDEKIIAMMFNKKEVPRDLDISQYPFLQESWKERYLVSSLENNMRALRMIGGTRLKELNDNWEKFSVEEKQLSEKQNELLVEEKQLSRKVMELFDEKVALTRKRSDSKREQSQFFKHVLRPLKESSEAEEYLRIMMAMDEAAHTHPGFYSNLVEQYDLNLSRYPFLRKSFSSHITLRNSFNNLHPLTKIRLLELIGTAKLEEFNDIWKKNYDEEKQLLHKENDFFLQEIQFSDKQNHLLLQKTRLTQKRIQLISQENQLFTQVLYSIDVYDDLDDDDSCC